MFRAAFLAVSVALAAPAETSAEPPPTRTLPTLEVEVDGPLDVDLGRRVGVGTGRVRLRAGPVRICCGRLELRYDDGGVERATCSRDVVVVVEPPAAAADSRPAPDAEGPAAVWATATEVRYAEGRVELEGGVRLWTLGGRLTGDRFTYALEGRRARLVGAPSRWVPTDAAPDLPRRCPASP